MKETFHLKLVCLQAGIENAKRGAAEIRKCKQVDGDTYEGQTNCWNITVFLFVESVSLFESHVIV